MMMLNICGTGATDQSVHYDYRYDEFMTVPTLKPENTLHSKTFTFNLDGKDKYLYGKCLNY